MSYQILSETRRTGNRSPSTPIHILDNDSLLIIFSLCRPVILDESEVDEVQILGGGEWNRERWWHRLIQVCRRWRYLVLESAFYLQASLVCARGTRVSDMLAHYPPLPLIIDHFDNLEEPRDVTAEDEEGIIFALQHRDRVRRIRFMKPIPTLQKLIVALDGEFPILEYLFIQHQLYQRPMIEHNTILNLPDSFRAPYLRHFVLMSFAIPIESPLLTTMGNLVTLSLNAIPSSAYFHPDALLQRISLMHQLETLGIAFSGWNPDHDVERQLWRMPIMTRVTLPNLRWFGFHGSSTYLEALLPWVTIPRLEKLQVQFYNRMIYSIPHLQQFMSTARNLLFKTATFNFSEECVVVKAYPHQEARMYTLYMELGGKYLDWQVVSASQVYHTLSTVFSAVEDLTLEYDRHFIPLEWNNEADRAYWRELLGSFNNVKTLVIDSNLVGQLSRALQPGEGESSTDLLPELQELRELRESDKPNRPSYPAIGTSQKAFTPFINARQKAGSPVNMIYF